MKLDERFGKPLAPVIHAAAALDSYTRSAPRLRVAQWTASLATVEYFSQVAAAEVQTGIWVADAVLPGTLDEVLPAVEEAVADLPRT